MADFISYSIAYLQINNKRLNVPSDITDLDDIFEWSEQSSQEVTVEFTSSSDILQKEPTVDLVAKQPKKHCFDPTDIVEIVVGKDGIAAKKPATIPDFFKETCSKSLHTKAVCWKDSKEVHWQSLTYAKYKELVYAVAKSFLKLGLETYHAVGILGFNSVEWFASSMGAVFAGGLSTGIYTTNSTEVCHYILNSSRANIIVVENQKLLDKILKIRDKLPHLKAIVQYKGELSKDYPDTYTWVKFLELGKDMDDSIIDKIINSQQPNQCAMLVYPDAVGSTDNLKGIMLSHDNITWVTAAYVDAIGEDKLKTHGGEKFISYLPLSHIVPLILDMYLPLYVGGTVYFSQPDALKGSLVITLQDVEPTFFFGVPRVWEKVNETCQNDNWIANAKSTRGIQKQQPYLIVTRQYHAVGLPEPYVWTEKQLFSLKMCKNTIVGVDPTHIIFLDYNTRSMYGVSECTGLQSLETKVSMPKIHMPKIHMPKIPSFVTEWSAGKSIRGVEAKLDCQEVFFRGRHVFMGYLGMEKETKETIDEEGWLHSGDTGNVYENGSLSIYDHMADVITMANEEKIYPAKMENLIKSKLPFLSNVVLIGDNQWYLTCLLTLKCFMDPDTGEATDDLQPQVIEMFQKLGSKCTTVSQVLKTEDKKVFNVIQQGIEFVAFVFHETSKHIIKKWKLLPTDFTMVGEELGPMLNLRRSLVLKKYKKEIETMYSS
ncbi:long-chain-fatty-acid--CoA ligase ACSBG2-like [Dysidea avara]|uniref:long-chain-fatty-acid--CoA ligase ACSBG2-like n=1 Tax=Dysidea avara TaxID=196820 RepID=UPI00332AF4FB